MVLNISPEGFLEEYVWCVKYFSIISNKYMQASGQKVVFLLGTWLERCTKKTLSDGRRGRAEGVGCRGIVCD